MKCLKENLIKSKTDSTLKINHSVKVFLLKLFMFLMIISVCVNFSYAAPQKHGPTKYNPKMTEYEARVHFVNYALKFKGRPYVWGANGPNAFDCSGYVTYVLNTFFNLKLPRRAKDIYAYFTKYVKPLSRDELHAGDIIFFTSGFWSSEINHMGIYAGKGKFISALSEGPKAGISVSDLDGSYWKDKFYAGGSLFK